MTRPKSSSKYGTTSSHKNTQRYYTTKGLSSIGKSAVSRSIWDKYRKWYFKIHQNTTSHRGGERYLGSFEISRAGIDPKYPEEILLFPVYTTRERNFALYVTAVIFTCKYFKSGLNTTGISQSHFRKFSACSKRYIYYPTALCRVLLRSKKSKNITLYWYCRGPVTQVYSQRARAELERS